jgi:transposase
LYYPQLLAWFDADQPVLADVLRRWPTIEQLRRARQAVLEEFLRRHGVPEAKRQSIAQQSRGAVAALSDAAVLESAQGKAQHLLRLQALLRQRIDELERRIDELTAQHPDRAIFASLPCAGQAMLPRLLAAFGTQRERFPSAHHVQCYAGIAPVQESSGKSSKVKWRWNCPTFLRQTFHEWAGLSRRRSAWARAYYHTQRTRGKTHHAAVRARAFKWIRILFRCWHDRTPYVESVYLAALQKRGNPVNVPCKKRPGLTPHRPTFRLTP